MTTTVRRTVAGYEIATGAIGLLLGWRTFFVWVRFGPTPVRVAGGLAAAGCLAAVVAGALLWRDQPAGRRLSVILQALTVPTITSPWVSYLYFVGLRLAVGLQYWLAPPSGLPAGARATGIAFAWNLGAGFSGSLLRPTPSIAVGVNVLALAALYALLRRPRSRGEASEPLAQVAV